MSVQSQPLLLRAVNGEATMGSIVISDGALTDLRLPSRDGPARLMTDMGKY